DGAAGVEQDALLDGASPVAQDPDCLAHVPGLDVVYRPHIPAHLRADLPRHAANGNAIGALNQGRIELAPQLGEGEVAELGFDHVNACTVRMNPSSVTVFPS